MGTAMSHRHHDPLSDPYAGEKAGALILGALGIVLAIGIVLILGGLFG